MNNDTMISIAVGVLAVVLVLYRQLRTRPLTPSYRMPAIMGVVGVGLTVLQLRQGATVSAVDVITFATGLVLAVGLAWPRARSMKVFRHDGQWLTRGTWLTVVLWLVLIGGHLAAVVLVPQLLGQAAGQPSAFDQATTPIFVGVSIASQTYLRARRVPVTDQASAPSPVGALR